MSLKKYIENKKQPNISIIVDSYKEKLSADLAGLLLKPDDKINELRKNIINMKSICNILSEISYPLINELEMAIKTADPQKVNHAHLKFKNWAKYAQPNSENCDFIETCLFNYQTKLYNQKLNAQDIDKAVESYLHESIAILEQMAHNINLAIKSISSWKDYPVKIEAVYPDSNWIIKEAKVTIGENYSIDFIYEHTINGFKIGKVNETESVPVNLKDSIQNLLLKLRNNDNYKKILTLYMDRPLSERRYFELAKRDLSLGIKTILPKHITLTDVPASESDLWKVKIEEKYLSEKIVDGIKKYNILGDDAPLKWIERITNEE